MGHGYAVIYDIIGEIVEYDRVKHVFVWELRPEIKNWRYVGVHIQPYDQPSLIDVARWYEEFWTSGEPLPAHNGLYGEPGQRVEVLRVELEPAVSLRVTLRPLEPEQSS